MSTTHTSFDCQVLVVGAGPTGLVLAAQLLARGINTRIIDKGSGPPPQSRALGIHARTLELLDVMGLAESFIDHGHQVRRIRMYAGGRNLLNLDMSRNGSRYGFILHLPQSETETLLRARVRELGGIIEDGVELVRLDQDSDVVHATIRDCSGRESEIGAGYLIGCDGAHSRVRHELGIAFEGQPYAQDWLLADVALDGFEREDQVHFFFRPNGLPLACIPMGMHRWRVVMSNAGDRGGQPPSLEEIQELVEQRAPRRISITDPSWLACFRCQLRSTDTYRSGRVLLAGDAAHIHSPAGGQGMNTGMMDVHNLAWKLALVADGRAPHSLLDSYGHERIPVASSVLGFTDKIVRLSTMRNPVKRAVRDTLLPTVTRLPAVQSRAARRLSQVSVAYPSSPLIQTDRVQRGLAPGHRVPDIEVRTEAGSTRLYEVLGHGRHVLLVSSVDVRIAIMAASLKCHRDLIEVVDTRSNPLGRRARRLGSFALVRPDGILAVQGRGKNIDKLVSYLRQIAGVPFVASRSRAVASDPSSSTLQAPSAGKAVAVS
jgi:2-polyprenyl-6-methoxyphenol hydroxylase-like FAD-dependent oxidoreductase